MHTPLSVSVVLALAASMLAGGCGHQGAPGPTTCKGVYADKTVDQLDLAAWCAGGGGTGCPTGSCQSFPDEEAVCANDIDSTETRCRVSCDGQGGGVSTKVTCTLNCMKKALNPVPSDDCLSCYLEDVQCTLAFCGTACRASEDQCAACRVKFGCAPYDCTGLPVPTGFNLYAADASNGGGANGGTSAGGGSHGGAGGVAGRP